MTTITRERLQEVIDGDILFTDEQRELARIALASLEAVPALYAAEETLAYAKMGELHLTCLSEPMGDAVIPLYTAPPAPVSMKDHQIRELVNELRDIAVEYHGTQQLRERIARTIRAAMLHGVEPVSNRDELPDGWVACSERMPGENAEKEVLACFKGGDISTLYYFEGRWDDAYGIVPIRQDATHWMPLPAAPQQEVKK